MSFLRTWSARLILVLGAAVLSVSLVSLSWGGVIAEAESPGASTEKPTGEEAPPAPLEYAKDPAGWPRAANTSFYLTMRDGVEIAVELWVPEDVVAAQGAEKPTDSSVRVPVVVAATRYWREVDKRTPESPLSFSERAGRQWTAQGYAYAVIDARGTGASGGVWKAPWGPDEVADYREIVDWLARQPWSNGRIAAYGTSYVGTTAEWIGALNHPAVKAVIPRFSIFDAYAHAAMPGGVMNDWFVKSWANMNVHLDANDPGEAAKARGVDPNMVRAMITGVKPVDGKDGAARLAQLVTARTSNVDLYTTVKAQLNFRDGRLDDPRITSGLCSPYGWRAQAEAAQVPTFVWASWMDGATAAGALARHATVATPQHIIIGSWNHGGNLECDPFVSRPARATGPTADEQMNMMEAFLRPFLFDAPEPSEPVDGGPPIPETDQIVYRVMGTGDWKQTHHWPPLDTGWVILDAAKTGELLPSEGADWDPAIESKPIGTIRHDPNVTSGSATRWRTQLGGTPVSYARANLRSDATLTMRADLVDGYGEFEFATSPYINLLVTPGQTDGAIHAWLEAVSPTGSRVVLSEGMTRLIHGPGGQVPPYGTEVFGCEAGFFSAGQIEVTKGEKMAVFIAMLPFAARIPSGWHIELTLAANDEVNFARYPEEGGSYEVHECSVAFTARMPGFEDGEWMPMEWFSPAESRVPERGERGDSAPDRHQLLRQRRATVQAFRESAARQRQEANVLAVRGATIASEVKALPVGEGERPTQGQSGPLIADSLTTLGLLLGANSTRREVLATRNEFSGRRAAGAEVPSFSFPDSVTGRWDEKWRNLALEKLRAHPDAQTIAQWLSEERRSDAEVRAAGFLLAYLPWTDLGALRRDMLVENVTLALKAIADAGWAKQVDDELFLHYVLPHRVAQEPLDFRERLGESEEKQMCFWRTILHRELAARVRGLPMYEAALEVNRWCAEWADFDANSSARDQGPLTTMQRGFGRCEELVILYICAARSVGIPARKCYTPYWAVNDNNHAWVEVWADGRWWYLGAAEPSNHLNEVWFDGPAKRAALVLSEAYGDVTSNSEQILARLGEATVINTTHVYGDVCEVSVAFPADIPEGYVGDVTVSLVNFGALRAIARFKSNRTIQLGGGDYLLTATTPIGTMSAIASNTSVVDGTARVLERISVTLSRRHFAALTTEKDTAYRLSYPVAPRTQGLSEQELLIGANPREGTEGYNRLVSEGRRASAEVRVRLRMFHQRAKARLVLQRSLLNLPTPEYDAAIDLMPEAERFRAQVKRAGNAAQHVLGLAGRFPNRLDGVVRFLERLDDKAIFEARAGILENHLGTWFERMDAMDDRVRFPADLWEPFVANPRVDEEPLNWAYSATTPLIQEVRSTAGAITRIVEALKPEFVVAVARPHMRNAHIASPAETSVAGALSIREQCIMAVAMIRAHHVPARLAASKEWVEYHDGTSWRTVYPVESVQRSASQGSESAAHLEQPGTVVIALKQHGKSVTWPSPVANYALARYARGAFQPERVEFATGAEGTLTTSLRPGIWHFFATQRTRRGDAIFRCYTFLVRSGETKSISVEFGIPPEMFNASDLVERTLATKPWPSGKIKPIGGGTEATLDKLHAGKPSLLVISDTKSEPGRRMFDELAEILKLCNDKQVAIHVIESEAGALADFDRRAKDAKLSGITAWQDATAASLAKDIGVKQAPCVILLDADGTTRLWTEGYNPSIRGLVVAGLAQLAQRK